MVNHSIPLPHFIWNDYDSKQFDLIIIIQTILFICPFEKRDVLWEHLWRAGGRRPQGFRFLSQRVFIGSLSNLVNMLVCIMSRPSSITSQIPPGTPELWPFNCPKLGFPLSMSKCFHPVLIKLGKYILVGIISWPSSITRQVP